MDSYIVRIYRRTDEPPGLAGQIEKAGTEMKKFFHSSGELMKILTGGREIVRESGTGSNVAAAE